MKSVEEMIKDMETQNGTISETASLAQSLKRVMRGGKNWDNLPPDAVELLEIVATSIARILEGDPEDSQHWNGAAACMRLRAQRIGTADAEIENGMAKLARRIRVLPTDAAQ